ncbi:MAG: sensor histidine kinase [Chitinophagaceae bacterium]|nr:sensor histidine kinase [Chitinophagaceae bacterium]MCW5929778.1 sensor histidine kinase [Chitinophagaceae bacterium]
MSKRFINIITHAICWLAFILFPFILSPNASGNFPAVRLPWPFIITNLLLIPFFYLNAYYLVPRLLFRRHNFLYFGIIALLLFVILLVPELIRPQPFYPENMERLPPRPPANGAWLIFRKMPGILFFCLVWVLGIMLRVVQRWRQAEKRSQEIELEKVNAELSYLKLQVNPHFLFNTLNNIYSLATIQSPQTPVAVMKLSDIMRYVTQDAQADFVTVEKEIDYLSNYIELQKLRSSEKLELDFQTGGNFSGTRIAPLLLISFVENAFKYGVSSHEKSKIIVRITEQSGTLHIFVQNTIFPRQEKEPGTNTGMTNTRRRLELLYPGKHTLTVEKQKNTFAITLELILK